MNPIYAQPIECSMEGLAPMKPLFPDGNQNARISRSRIFRYEMYRKQPISNGQTNYKKPNHKPHR